MINRSLLDTFATDGAVAVRGLLDAEWIQLLRDAMPGILTGTYDPGERMGGDEAKTTRTRDGIWRSCEGFARFLFESPIGAVAAAFMRSQVAQLYEDLLLYQDAGGQGAAGWHRDSPHWPVSGQQMSSVWFSLESVTEDTGAMRFVTGSHLDGEDQVDPTAIGVRESDVAARPVVTYEAEPGDVVVFTPGCYIPPTDRRRIGRAEPSPCVSWVMTSGSGQGDRCITPGCATVGCRKATSSTTPGSRLWPGLQSARNAHPWLINSTAWRRGIGP